MYYLGVESNDIMVSAGQRPVQEQGRITSPAPLNSAYEIWPVIPSFDPENVACY